MAGVRRQNKAFYNINNMKGEDIKKRREIFLDKTVEIYCHQTEFAI